MSVPPTESDNDSLKNIKNVGVSSSSRQYIARYPSFTLDSISYITKDMTSKYDGYIKWDEMYSSQFDNLQNF